MNASERERRLELFLCLADQLPNASSTINSMYDIVSRFDVPRHLPVTDREFIFDCLISYFSKFEEYERCADLVNMKTQQNRKKRITATNLTRKDLLNLRMFGFDISDNVVMKVLTRSGSY
jgi:hypothetical protein